MSRLCELQLCNHEDRPTHCRRSYRRPDRRGTSFPFPHHAPSVLFRILGFVLLLAALGVFWGVVTSFVLLGWSYVIPGSLLFVGCTFVGFALTQSWLP